MPSISKLHACAGQPEAITSLRLKIELNGRQIRATRGRLLVQTLFGRDRRTLLSPVMSDSKKDRDGLPMLARRSVVS
ncbi:hypothetical protein DPMN_177593 [Dreissena polymorpha]|uniref:Uncharacterized protein n=1 Tax=Dreissena polymorpha TaxID=45954 RepID=A0A9D4EDK3_DREPO|nr:hypothetical protein DPMN_177593 [Dreissena polymorpha]